MVSIIVRGNRLYLRATLPLKNDGSGRKQQDISTGLKDDPQGRKIAAARAKKLEADLALQKFKWSDWIDLPPEGTILIGKAIHQFEAYYWETRKRNAGREQNFKLDYGKYFDKLPPDEPLSAEALKKALLRFDPDSFYRARAHLAYGALARWANIELSSEWKFLKGKYQSPRDRTIPSDEEIEENIDRIGSAGWRWIYGILAAYGLRPHEIFHISLERFPALLISANTKTGARLVYPLKPHWPTDWGLEEKHLPNFKFEGTNKVLGTKVSNGFKQQGIGFQPYALRDCYARRAAEMGIDSLVVSKWMGHSVSVHARHYACFIDEVSMLKIWKNL